MSLLFLYPSTVFLLLTKDKSLPITLAVKEIISFKHPLKAIIYGFHRNWGKLFVVPSMLWRLEITYKIIQLIAI